MKTPVVFLLLAAGLEAASVDKYFEIGGKLSLKPESVPKEGITAINWKHKGNFVAEWMKENVPLNYFGDFKGRTDLNPTTGELTIRSMTKADEGIFSVEVNNKAQIVHYSARGITHLRDTKVEALARPVACTFSSQHCNLSCIADVTDVGPAQYFWQQDEGQWKELQKNININNDEETQLIKTFSCKIKNPISEKKSEPLENPFKPEEQSNAGLVGGIIFLVFLILGGIGLGLFAYKCPQKLVPCLPCVAGRPEPRHTEGSPDDGENGASGRIQASSKTPPESVEINETTPLKDHETLTPNGTPGPQHTESCVMVHENTEANTKTSNKTPPEPDEINETTPLKDHETGTPNGTPAPQQIESSEIVHENTEANTRASNKTPPESDEINEKTPLKDAETSNETPEKS